MSLRITTLLVIAVTTLALIGLLLLSLNATLLPHFEREQQQATFTALQRAQGALNSQLDYLEQTARDWARWDDTYAFIQSPTPAYVQSNLQTQTLLDLGLNLIMMLDPDGQVVYVQYLDALTHQPVDLPPALQAKLLDARLLALVAGSDGENGLLDAGSQAILLAAQPILPTSGLGPAAGILLLGSDFDQAAADRMADVTQVPFQLLPVNSAADAEAVAAAQSLQAGSNYYTVNIADQTLHGYILQTDIFDQPAYMLRIQQARAVYKNGILLTSYLFIALTMSALTFAIILFLILEITVLRRMRGLSREMAAIGASGDLSQRVTVQRQDEISSLSRSINSMLSDLQSSQAALRQLSRRLVEVQEEERRQIALELHDEIGQILTGLKLQMQAPETFNAREARERMQRAQEMTSELIGRVRQMSLNLRPSMLDDLGLLPTLVWHFERYQHQTNIHVVFQQSNLEGRRFAFEIETAAYRVIQEALTNAARHSGVKEVTVRAWQRDGWLGLQVEDSGSGFNPGLVFSAAASRGLMGMRERVAYLGGSLDIDSTPGHGTCITVEIPVEDRQNEHTNLPGG